MFYNAFMDKERVAYEKILLVEDDAEICEIITEYFGNKGTEVAAAHNGFKLKIDCKDRRFTAVIIFYTGVNQKRLRLQPVFYSFLLS